MLYVEWRHYGTLSTKNPMIYKHKNLPRNEEIYPHFTCNTRQRKRHKYERKKNFKSLKNWMHFCSVPHVSERINKLLSTALKERINERKRKEGSKSTERERNTVLWFVSCSNAERGEQEKFTKYFLNYKRCKTNAWVRSHVNHLCTWSKYIFFLHSLHLSVIKRNEENNDKTLSLSQTMC